MENQQVQLKSITRIRSMVSKAIINVVPQQTQQNGTQLESIQEILDPNTSPSPLAFIEFRIQHLHNRRLLLLNMQQFRKKAKNNREGSEEEATSEDGDELCELEAIQEELEELQKKKEELQKQGQQVTCVPHSAEIPAAGVSAEEPAAERPKGPLIPVESLGKMANITQCPSCQEVVFTTTHKKVGGAMFVMCCLFSMIGCVAGCCLIPFFMDRLKNVHHVCPRCQKHIHTYQPL